MPPELAAQFTTGEPVLLIVADEVPEKVKCDSTPHCLDLFTDLGRKICQQLRQRFVTPSGLGQPKREACR
jgi:hypothetical protein